MRSPYASGFVVVVSSALARATYGAGIDFSSTKIPSVDGVLPILSLENSVPFPEDNLREIFKDNNDTNVQSKVVGGDVLYLDGERLVALFDGNTNQTVLLPRLESLEPVRDLNTEQLAHFANDTALFPQDDTKVKISAGLTLSASIKNGTDIVHTSPQVYLREGLVQRYVEHGDLSTPVCGPGTVASFHFGSEGSVKALSHRWRVARALTAKRHALSPDKVEAQISRQLAGSKIAQANITSVDFCLYDSGGRFIQPVFRYRAQIPLPSGEGLASIEGFIPASGREYEPLPRVTPSNKEVGPKPNLATTVNDTNAEPSAAKFEKRQDGGIAMGRYVMSNNDLSDLFVKDANALWNGFSDNYPGANRQFFWAEPFEYSSDDTRFVDAVDLAYTVGHGSAHHFVTNGAEPGSGPVNIPKDIAATGFGGSSAPGARLSYWMIDTCDTVAAPVDYPPPADADAKAFGPWFPVFDGLHAVMGFRGLSDGDTTAGLWWHGRLMGAGAPVLASWLFNMNRHGRTAGLIVCGHEGDTINQRQDIGRAGCLTEWWYND